MNWDVLTNITLFLWVVSNTGNKNSAGYTNVFFLKYIKSMNTDICCRSPNMKTIWYMRKHQWIKQIKHFFVFKWFTSFYDTCNSSAILWEIYFICSGQFSLLSIINPRNFALSTYCIHYMNCRKYFTIHLGLNIYKNILSILKNNRLAFNLFKRNSELSNALVIFLVKLIMPWMWDKFCGNQMGIGKINWCFSMKPISLLYTSLSNDLEPNGKIYIIR